MKKSLLRACEKIDCGWHKGKFGIIIYDKLECGLPAECNTCEEWLELRKINNIR